MASASYSNEAGAESAAGEGEEAMKARPIIFSGPMVRALLDGQKSQTRRVVKPQPFSGVNAFGRQVSHEGVYGWDKAVPKLSKNGCLHMVTPDGDAMLIGWSPYGTSGELLYVREAFYCDLMPYDAGGGLPSPPTSDITDNLYYRADGSCCQQIPECCCAEVGKPRWRPSIHMPRWASRLTLQLTDVRVERVRDISIDDAIDEGADWPMVAPEEGGLQEWRRRIRDHGFRQLWDSINAAKGHGWDVNPWVWALSFRVIHANVDDVLAEPTRYLEAA